ncbi:glycine cleavage system protein R [Roseospirillum parvum]|uniref:Glycine cleavage system transcriptional repressor n=1 Tax=Roseospirillum parvum TaxID=83401 RepID=A0A1G8CXE1_9PROT|nr:ACT domain-containing protein [Roseospirillum parvum]SDH50034.1 glycine cleavage system transcriptional repressor [Roseospirillum parvum]
MRDRDSYLISLACPDRTGLVAAVCATLFDLGGDLGDSSFAVLAGAAEFSAVVDMPAEVSREEIAAALAALPEAHDARIAVDPVAPPSEAAPERVISHRIRMVGDNRPGLIARVAESFVQYKVNVVRLDAERLPGSPSYVMRFEVAIPPRNVGSCLATLTNTAGELGLTCHYESA